MMKEGKRKIGVFTHHWVANFGANLQALASKLAFENAGADPVFLDYKEPGWEQRVRGKAEVGQMAMHDQFVSHYLPCSQPLASLGELEEYCEAELDVVVVGSDAMLMVDAPTDPFIIARCLRKREPLPDARLPAFWLPWNGGNTKRATLSASAMGTNYHFIWGELRKQMRRSLEEFDYLGVRDDWTARMIKGLSGRQPFIRPDPVFSLRRNIGALEHRYGNLEKTVLLSGPLDEGWARRFAVVLKGRGYTVAGVRIPEVRYEYSFTDYNINEPLDPLEWFAILGSCAGYLGIRFHALVTCMVHSRPVINVDPHRKSEFIRGSSKMFDLCKRASTPERFFTLDSIRKADPVQVADLLFSPSLVEKADAYCDGAELDFQREVREILDLVNVKGVV